MNYIDPAFCPMCKGTGMRPRVRALTRKQRLVLTFVTTTIQAEGVAPSFEEIAAHFGFRSLSTVHEHLSNLQRKGFILRGFHEARAIELVA